MVHGGRGAVPRSGHRSPSGRLLFREGGAAAARPSTQRVAKREELLPAPRATYPSEPSGHSGAGGFAEDVADAVLVVHCDHARLMSFQLLRGGEAVAGDDDAI